MKLRILFIVTVAALVALLGLQLATVKEEGEPQVLYYASWANLANNLSEANNLSNQIVLGRVVEVQPGPDLVTELPEEPGGVDRIPIEVVCIRVEEVYKGSPGGRLALFHTGLSTPGSLEEADAIPPDETPPPQDEQPLGPSTGGQERSIILEDDPPYQLGERYVLFLTDGPPVGNLPTEAVIAPEGRYLVAAGDQLQPVTARGFAPQMAGSSLQALEFQLPPGVPPDSDDAACPSVGGAVELLADGSNEAAAAGASGSSIPYATIAGGIAAAVLAIAASGWYARRRRPRRG